MADIMLQPFEPKSYLTPTSSHQWSIVEQATSFRPHGSPVEVREPGVHVVQIRWPRMQGGPITFPQLPPEIRQMIWKQALPDPRVLYLEMQESVPLQPEERRASLRKPPTITEFHVELMPSSNPHFLNMAQLCQESRAIFLQHYGQLMFWNVKTGLAWEDLEDTDLPTAADGTKIRLWQTERYIDFNRDTLGVSREFFDDLKEKDGAVCLSERSGMAVRIFWGELENLKTMTITLGKIEFQPINGYDCRSTLDLVNIEKGTIDMIEEKNKHLRRPLIILGSPQHSPSDTEQLLISAKRVTEETWKNVKRGKSEYGTLDEHTLQKDINWLNALEFRVAMTSHRLRPLHTVPEKAWVVPDNPQYHGVAFYTWRPAPVGMNDQQYLDALDIAIPCDLEGSIGTPVAE
ncbi:hypothetical protein N431DRAFT_462387 [Stipitochalara longipes BDJ]|nr:hypothetical protein N431DRAFT_462387 [Stipitochalara longipes BDJ]